VAAGNAANSSGPNAVHPTLVDVTTPRIAPRWAVPKQRGKVAASIVRIGPARRADQEAEREREQAGRDDRADQPTMCQP